MISCDKHDYLEIACTFQFKVKLVTKDGDIYLGKATNLRLNKARQECLQLKLIENDTDGKSVCITLDELTSMEALVDNPHFDKVNF